MTSQRSVVFAEPVRTAIGTFCGSPGVPAPNPRPRGDRCRGRACKLRPDEVKTVAMGNVVQAGTKMNPARQAGLARALMSDAASMIPVGYGCSTETGSLRRSVLRKAASSARSIR
jgi:acetyl-CoA C-acetyltransferase